VNNKILLVVLTVLVLYYVNMGSFKEKTSFFNSDVIIKNVDSNKLETYQMEDYLVGVIAGEMPASFEFDALKAQAIASRTFAYYKKENVNQTYDLTNDISTQVHLTKEQMRQKWHEDYDYYLDIITKAVKETENLVLAYNNEIISAYYFSMSNGYTENSLSVFNEKKNYLQSVVSNEDTQNNNFKQVLTIDKDDFCQKLDISCDYLAIKNVKKNNACRVESITINNKNFTGIEVRQKLNLRSTDFEINVKDKIEITTYGYGHGVGMSQYGANTMAKNGYNFEEILKHYYSGIEIKDITSII